MNDRLTRRVFDTAARAAREAAQIIADEARRAVAARGRFVMAVSGGRTPWRMLHILAGEHLPWDSVHVAQVDERIAPADDPDRNLTRIRQCLGPLMPERIVPMPVEDTDLVGATQKYARALEAVAGSPMVLDLVHLGLGADGHTASLFPGDPALEATDADVALTGIHQNRRRMTLTYPAINRARRILWVVTGADKAQALARLMAGDRSIPAGGIARDGAVVVADQAACGGFKERGGRHPNRHVGD